MAYHSSDNDSARNRPSPYEKQNGNKASRTEAAMSGAGRAGAAHYDRAAIEPPHRANLFHRQPHTTESPLKDMRPIAADSLAAIVEGEIIPRLLLAHAAPAGAIGESAPLRADLPSVESFARMTIDAGVDEVIARVQAIIAGGVSHDKVCAALIAPAARQLGRWWESDDCSFADVTIALGKLRILVGLFIDRVDIVPAQAAPSALLAAAPREEHTLGLAVIGCAFREAGWQVKEVNESTARSLILMVRRTKYDVVGLTAASDDAYEGLAGLIRALRTASSNRSLAIMVGGAAFLAQPQRVQACGADATAADGVSAVARASELLDAYALRV